MATFKPGRWSRQDPPSKPGLYRFRNKETSEIDYQGDTNDLRRRMGEHLRSDLEVSRDTHHFEWKQADGRSTSRTRRIQERIKIDSDKPRLNRRRGGGGRTPG